MGTGEQELKLKATVDGAKEAARDISKVGKATEQVGKQADGAKQPVKEQAEAQKEVNAAGSDYIGILSQIHPSLGAFAGAMLNAVKVSGDLANKQIDLKGMLDAATAAAKNNAGALKLIGAGGAVVAAIMAIMHALALMRAEADRVKASIRAMVDELNALEGKKIEVQADLERRSAARPEGPYGVVESAKALQAYEALGGKAPYLTDEARKQAVLVGGVDATLARLEQIAVLFESPGKAWHGPDDLIARDAAGRESALDVQLEHFAEQIATAITREQQQAYDTMVRRAMEEARSGVAATSANIAEWIKTLPGGVAEGMKPEQLAEVVQGLYGLKTPFWRKMPWDDAFSKHYRDLELIGKTLRAENVGGVTGDEGPANIRAAQMILQQLEKAAENLNRATEKLDGKLEVGATHHHTHNDKYVVAPGSASTVGAGRRNAAGD